MNLFVDWEIANLKSQISEGGQDEFLPGAQDDSAAEDKGRDERRGTSGKRGQRPKAEGRVGRHDRIHPAADTPPLR